MKRLITLVFIMVLTALALSTFRIQIAYAQKPIRCDVYPNPYLIAADKTRNFQVGILNTYATETATYTVTVTVVHPNYFTVTNPTQTGTLNPAAFKELIFAISASKDVPVGVYADEISVNLSYTVAGANYQDSLTATAEVRQVQAQQWIATLQQWEQQKAAQLQAWEQEVITELSPSLSVSATPSSTKVKQGESFDVTVVVNNAGTGPANNVQLTLTPTDAFSLRTAATVTITSLNAGGSQTISYGLTAKDNAAAQSYSPGISYQYVNALATSLGLGGTPKTGSTSFTVTVEEIPFTERYRDLIIVGIIAVVVIAVVALVASRRK
jgi:hypothetical protein